MRGAIRKKKDSSKLILLEASHYLNKVNFLAKIPYLGRPQTITLVDAVYKIGAYSVEISKIQQNTSPFIMEMYVRANSNRRDILNILIKSIPCALEEVKFGVFRVEWTLDWGIVKKIYNL